MRKPESLSAADPKADVLVSYLLRKLGGTDPVRVIEDEVQRMRIKCLGLRGASSLPTDVWKMARFCGVEVSATGLGSLGGANDTRGVLEPVRSGFKLVLRNGLTPSAANMTIAHELGHTLFYHRTTSVPHRPYGLAPSRNEEELCELAARAILLPEECVRPFIKRHEASGFAERIVRLARAARATIHATARRIVQDLADIGDSVGLVAALMWTNGERELASQDAIRPKWSVGQYFIPLGGRCHVAKDSVVYRLFCDSNRTSDEVVEDVAIGRLVGRFKVDVFTTESRQIPKWVFACYRRLS